LRRNPNAYANAWDTYAYTNADADASDTNTYAHTYNTDAYPYTDAAAGGAQSNTETAANSSPAAHASLMAN